MGILVLLLSAVNVGGRKAPSADLRAVCAGLGWERAETLLASGNVIADVGDLAPADAAAKLEAAIRDRFGFDSAVIARTADDLDGVIARQPYAEFQPNLLLTHFLPRAPTPDAAAALEAFNREREDYVLDGREVFLRYESGMANAKLTAAVLKRTLGVPGTARNWNTVLKLRDRARALEGFEAN